MNASLRNSLTAAGAIAAALALPAVAGAATADDQADVQARVGTELAIVVTDPAEMTLTHAAAGTTALNVEVTSTAPSYDVSIADGGADANGRLDRTAGAGPRELQNPLQFKIGADTPTALTATEQSLFSSSGVDDRDVDFQQTLGADEDVIAGDTYSLTALFSALTP